MATLYLRDRREPLYDQKKILKAIQRRSANIKLRPGAPDSSRLLREDRDR